MTERNETSETRWVPPGVAAKTLGITPEHLARLADKGVIRAIRPSGPGGHRRYAEADIEARLAREPWDAA
jgi:excisionase family DNA binding protein